MSMTVRRRLQHTGDLARAFPRVHFIGIGGVGMSGIAEVLCTLGYQVSRLGQGRQRRDPPAGRAGRRPCTAATPPPTCWAPTAWWCPARSRPTTPN